MTISTRTSIIQLLWFFLISLVLLALGGWLTYAGLGDWYFELDFPPFQPPPWLFTPAWIVVLSALALSSWLVARLAPMRGTAVALAMGLYGAQCVMNAGWSLLFFTVQRPDMALWQLLVFDAVLLVMVWSYTRVSKWAGVLLIPYVGWLGLSTAINGWIVLNNSFPAAAVL